MNIQKILLLACFSGVIPAVAFAQDNTFGELDANSDGYITEQEVELVWPAELFDEVDENDDSKISAAEYALAAGK